MTSPELVYAELRALTPEKPGRAYRVFPGADGIEVRAFVDGESRLPGLSITVPKKHVPEDMQIPRVRGAQFTVLIEGGPGRPARITYELIASQQAFSSVFVELAARLITEVREEKIAEAAVMQIARRLAAWTRFFDERGEEGLGRSGQLGLIGELLCLRKLSGIFGLGRSVSAWTGPEGTPHDFQNLRGAIEAKLTTSSAPERLRITSERQLDNSAIPWLGLFAVLAQEAASGSVGLGEIVQEIHMSLEKEAPMATSLFHERLTEAGYSESDREHYKVKLAIRAQEFLHVSDTFPRVMPAELRSGVFNVKYDLSWSAIAPYRITDEEVRRRFGVSD